MLDPGEFQIDHSDMVKSFFLKLPLEGKCIDFVEMFRNVLFL